jgi:hypothetical protein
MGSGENSPRVYLRSKCCIGHPHQRRAMRIGKVLWMLTNNLCLQQHTLTIARLRVWAQVKNLLNRQRARLIGGELRTPCQ